MNQRKLLNKVRSRRVRRARARIFGTGTKPRLAVFRSNKHLYAQLIDDEKGHTLASASSKDGVKPGSKERKTERALLVGGLVAKQALERGIREAVFDRRSYKYHGRVAAVAEGARKGGLKL